MLLIQCLKHRCAPRACAARHGKAGTHSLRMRTKCACYAHTARAPCLCVYKSCWCLSRASATQRVTTGGDVASSQRALSAGHRLPQPWQVLVKCGAECLVHIRDCARAIDCGHVVAQPDLFPQKLCGLLKCLQARNQKRRDLLEYTTRHGNVA